MNRFEKRCKKKCREIVRQGGYCENCGDPTKDWDLHHGLFKSSQRYRLNPFLWYDPSLQFRLCNRCHLHADDAPHKDQAAFERRMAIRTPDKAKRLREVNSKPVPPVIDQRLINWEKVFMSIEQHGRPIGNEILGLG